MMVRKVLVVLAVIGVVGALGIGIAAADGTLALHNNTAGVGTDCPDTINSYWHFVVTPNNGSLEFDEIRLNIDGVGVVAFSGSDIIPNGSQLDNVFIQVPSGSSLDDLLLTDSEADIIGDVQASSNFNLSHVCDGTGAEFGELSVNKAVVDPSPGQNVIPATFHVEIECTDNGSVTKSASFDLVPGAAPGGGPAQTVTEIPAGSTCVVTEDAQPGGVGVTYSSNNILVEEGDQESVTVTNTYPEVSPNEDGVSPAPAAEAVQVTPAFTG
jgi:hypothetical protein